LSFSARDGRCERVIGEARINVKDGIARVFFTVDRIYMVLLHGFIKKSQKTPDNDLETAVKRLKKYQQENEP
jgi:phage-related protein